SQLCVQMSSLIFEEVLEKHPRKHFHKKQFFKSRKDDPKILFEESKSAEIQTKNSIDFSVKYPEPVLKFFARLDNAKEGDRCFSILFFASEDKWSVIEELSADCSPRKKKILYKVSLDPDLLEGIIETNKCNILGVWYKLEGCDEFTKKYLNKKGKTNNLCKMQRINSVFEQYLKVM
ncbi:MAG: hypothetical protein MHPSP_001626, partial [Paramarteilia canceri]